MVKTLPLTKARINLGAVVKKIHLNKEYVILEKDGIPIVGIMDIDEFEDYLELQNPKAKEALRKSNQEYLMGESRPFEEYLSEVAVRQYRKAQKRLKA